MVLLISKLQLGNQVVGAVGNESNLIGGVRDTQTLGLNVTGHTLIKFLIHLKLERFGLASTMLHDWLKKLAQFSSNQN